MRESKTTNWLNSKVEQRDLEGAGMYAVQPLAQEERIWSLTLPLKSVASQLIYVYLSLDNLGGASFTHSCDPNAGFRGTTELVAMRPILRDEQITFDYAMCLPFSFGQMSCCCGAATCRKIVTGHDWELPELQQRYQGYFQPFIAEKISQVNRRRKGNAPHW